MATRKKILTLTLIITSLLIGLVVCIYTLSKKASNAVSENSNVEVKIGSKELLAAFMKDEATANKNFVEKIIEVEGQVRDITFLNDRYTILLQGQGDYACLMCDMNPEQIEKIGQIKKGDNITLKGICKGFLMDAILLNCVLIKNSDE
ncbi:MAG: hypothetical protein AAGB24_14820 [Bacteroidota bacterium]